MDQYPIFEAIIAIAILAAILAFGLAIIMSLLNWLTVNVFIKTADNFLDPPLSISSRYFREYSSAGRVAGFRYPY